MACGWTTCSNEAFANVGELQLTAEEDATPTISPTGNHDLYNQTGWVRGTWPAGMQATDPSGTCGVFVVFGDLPAPFSGAPEARDTSRWKQCADQSISPLIDTSISHGNLNGQSVLGEGQMRLRFTATNAAYNPGTQSYGTTNLIKAIQVDNSTPWITVSGPTDAPSTSGTQYVTAAAGGSPSGIAGISCSVDNAPGTWFPGASARVPVSGIGPHRISCSAANNAVDASGNHGWSQPATWSLKIGQPTALAISFSHVVNSLRCRHVRLRVRVPPRWVTVRRGGHRIRVKAPGFTRIVTLTRCHPRTALRRVVVWTVVRRGGHLVAVRRIKRVRVVLPPHAVTDSSRRVAFGRRATVSGWLGSSTGTALGGRTVRVMAAPADGQNLFRQVAAATTHPDGSWSATLPPGPSRLVQAEYAGGPDTESTTSTIAHILVPASIRISVHPTGVHWGGRITISGRLLGGYIPPQSNVLKLLFGHGPRPHTIGTPDVRPDGRFTIPIAWSTGRGVVTYWFAVATLSEADYPYASGISRHVVVTVGR